MQFIIMFVLFFGLNFYVFWRIWQLVPSGGPWRGILAGCATLVVVCFFAFFLARNSIPIGLGTVVYRIGTSWSIIFLYLLMAVLIIDILRLVNVFPTREIFHENWKTLGVIAGVMLVIFISGYITYQNKKRVEIDIPLEKSIDGFENLKIVAVSDLHLGYGTGNRELARWVKLINDENPDIIIIGGDLVDSDVRPLDKWRTANVLSGLQARFGVFAVPGNHEYISGIEPSERFIGEAGITLLKDSVATVAGIRIAGRDDLTNTGRKTLEELLSGTDDSMPVIVLDHQPVELEQASRNGIDFQFSGHTHRGQVWPISWITDRIFEDSHGLIKKDDSHIFVSSGLGIWGGKFRIGTRSEYIVVNLKSL